MLLASDLAKRVFPHPWDIFQKDVSLPQKTHEQQFNGAGFTDKYARYVFYDFFTYNEIHSGLSNFCVYISNNGEIQI